jgi:hypothetical protein
VLNALDEDEQSFCDALEARRFEDSDFGDASEDNDESDDSESCSGDFNEFDFLQPGRKLVATGQPTIRTTRNSGFRCIILPNKIPWKCSPRAQPDSIRTRECLGVEEWSGRGKSSPSKSGRVEWSGVDHLYSTPKFGPTLIILRGQVGLV